MDKNSWKLWLNKTASDLNDFQNILPKVIIESALNAKLDDHLGYDKYEEGSPENSCNGYSNKILIEVSIETPRDL